MGNIGTKSEDTQFLIWEDDGESLRHTQTLRHCSGIGRQRLHHFVSVVMLRNSKFLIMLDYVVASHTTQHVCVNF